MSTAHRKHFAVYVSSGTFIAEQSEREAPNWEGDGLAFALIVARKKANEIVERYGARPFAFSLVTRIAAEPISDGEGGLLQVQSKEVARTGNFYLGGRVEHFEEVPPESILASNMRANRWPLVIRGIGASAWAQPFLEGDAVVSDVGEITVRGSQASFVEYRAKKIAEWAGTES